MSVSFIVPCFNEEKNIVKTINSIVYATKKLKIKNQIIIINDGSTDRTDKILLKFKKSKKIKILRNKFNSGLGFSFNKALKNAECKWVVMIPGDDDIKSKYIIKFIRKKDDNKLIVGYMKNMREKRGLFRTIVSNLFTIMSNFIFNKKFKYYIGIQLHNKNHLKQIKISYKNYLYQPEIFIKTINKYKILEYVNFVPRNREHGKSKLFNFKNYFEMINFFIKFFSFRFVKIESKIL